MPADMLSPRPRAPGRETPLKDAPRRAAAGTAFYLPSRAATCRVQATAAGCSGQHRYPAVDRPTLTEGGCETRAGYRDRRARDDRPRQTERASRDRVRVAICGASGCDATDTETQDPDDGKSARHVCLVQTQCTYIGDTGWLHMFHSSTRRS